MPWRRREAARSSVSRRMSRCAWLPPRRSRSRWQTGEQADRQSMVALAKGQQCAAGACAEQPRAGAVARCCARLMARESSSRRARDQSHAPTKASIAWMSLKLQKRSSTCGDQAAANPRQRAPTSAPSSAMRQSSADASIKSAISPLAPGAMRRSYNSSPAATSPRARWNRAMCQLPCLATIVSPSHSAGVRSQPVQTGGGATGHLEYVRHHMVRACVARIEFQRPAGSVFGGPHSRRAPPDRKHASRGRRYSRAIGPTRPGAPPPRARTCPRRRRSGSPARARPGAPVRRAAGCATAGRAAPWRARSRRRAAPRSWPHAGVRTGWLAARPRATGSAARNGLAAGHDCTRANRPAAARP